MTKYKKGGRPRVEPSNLVKTVIIKAVAMNPLNIKKALAEASEELTYKHKLQYSIHNVRYIWYGSKHRDPNALRNKVDVFTIISKYVTVVNRKL